MLSLWLGAGSVLHPDYSTSRTCCNQHLVYYTTGSSLSPVWCSFPCPRVTGIRALLMRSYSSQLWIAASYTRIFGHSALSCRQDKLMYCLLNMRRCPILSDKCWPFGPRKQFP